MEINEEQYINGRVLAVQKLLSLQNQNNINPERKRNAQVLVRNKLRELRNSSSKNNDDVVEEEPAEPEQEDEVQEEKEEVSEAVVELEPQPDLEPEAVVDAKEDEDVPNDNDDNNVDRDFSPQQKEEEQKQILERKTETKYQNNLNIRELPTTTFQASYKPPVTHRSTLPRRTAAFHDDDDDEQLSFVERRMRYSGNLSNKSAPPTPNHSVPGTPKPQQAQAQHQTPSSANNNNNNPKQNASSAENRPNLRQRNQIQMLRKSCINLCKVLDKKIEDLITEDAPKEEWVNLHNDLLAETKKHKALNIYRDALDWSSLIVQQVTETFHPAGFKGKGFSKIIRESEDFDQDLEELYEQQEIPWFRNVPPAASVVNKFVKKYCENHWRNLTQEQEAEGEDVKKAPTTQKPAAAAVPSNNNTNNNNASNNSTASRLNNIADSMPPRNKIPKPEKKTKKKKVKHSSSDAAFAQQMQQMQQMIYYQNMMMQQQQQQYTVMMQQMQKNTIPNNNNNNNANVNIPTTLQPLQQIVEQKEEKIAIPDPLPQKQISIIQPQPQQPEVKAPILTNYTPQTSTNTVDVAINNNNDQTKVDTEKAMQQRAAFFKSKLGNMRR